MLLVGPAPKGEALVGDIAVVMGVKEDEAGMGIMAGHVSATGQLAVLLQVVPLEPSVGGEDADADMVVAAAVVEEGRSGLRGRGSRLQRENHLPREPEERGWAFAGGLEVGEGVKPGVLLEVPGVSTQLVSSLDMATSSSDGR